MNYQFYEKIARFYDAENAEFTDDLMLYSELAEETGDPILDVGCGTGRVMLHLAQEGYRVVGLDLSQEMLARGQRKLDVMPDLKPLVTFVHADALKAEFDERFNLIIIPYNTFMQFQKQTDQLAVLRRYGQMLTDDGLLVMDLPNATELVGTQDDGTMVLERMFTEPESGHLVMQQSVSSVEQIAQVLHVTWIYDEIGDGGALNRTMASLSLRYVFPGEMDLMLAAAGLRRVEVYGDFVSEPFADGSPKMIVVAARGQAK